MMFHDDEEKEKDSDTVSEEAVGKVMDEDADEEEAVSPVLEDEEKAWE